MSSSRTHAARGDFPSGDLRASRQLAAHPLQLSVVMQTRSLLSVVAGCVLPFAIGCGSSEQPTSSSSSLGFGGAGGPQESARCATGTDLVYTVSSDDVLRTFDPSTRTFGAIGKLDCPDKGKPYSMAVDRHGVAWVLYTTGHLYNVRIADASCTSTTFAVGQQGFAAFGMGFSSNGNASNDETLFVDSRGRLGKIDTDTLKLDVIGTFDKTHTDAELTGTGNGKLFGAFEGTPFVVSEIDKVDATNLSMAPQSDISYAPDDSNFAFAFWGGDFWLFVGQSTTDVFHYTPSTGVTEKVQSASFQVVGAGVSTCAPTVPPK
jgi:hypothetical protein